MNVSGLTPSSSAYASTTNWSTGTAVSPFPSRSQAQGGSAGKLSQEDAEQVAKLKQIDRQVRQHEQAHLAAAGGLATSGASFTYQKGPDGMNYAVGGEVGIDTSPGRTPEETISRAQTIRSAALAPADPSGQDRAVAAQATQMEQQATMAQAQQVGGSESAEDSDARRQQMKISNYYSLANTAGSGGVVSIYA